CSSPPCKFCQNPPLWHPGYHTHTPGSGPPQLWLSCGRTSGARATSRSSHRPSVPALREHAAVLLHKPELTKGSQRPYRRLSGHWPETAFGEVCRGRDRGAKGNARDMGLAWRIRAVTE